MKLSRIAFGIAVAAMAGVAGCTGDVTSADADDALALDSTLKLQVLAAKGDSVPAIGEAQDVVRPPEPRPADLEPPPAPATARSAAPVAARSAPPAPVAASRAVARAPARASESRVAVRPAPAPAPASRASASARPAESVSRPAEPVRSVPATRERSTRLRSTATIPSGTRLALSSSSRVCVTSSDVGDRISARTTTQLTGPIGTVIPSGARATGVITSLTGPLGEEQLVFDIRWISVGGTSYTVSTRVIGFELDRRAGAERCMPAGGEIEARLTEPLRVRL